MSDGAVSAGLFGKMPAHGDFVARGDPALVAWFAAWLDRGLADLAAARGTGPDRLIAEAPVWRFAVRREGAAVAGAMLPSGDRVGRLFPLLIFAESEAADAIALSEAIAALPLDRTTTADEAVAAVTDAVPGESRDDAGWPGADAWRSDAGDVLVFDSLPVGEDFARLFAPVEATA